MLELGLDDMLLVFGVLTPIAAVGDFLVAWQWGGTGRSRRNRNPKNSDADFSI